MISHGISHTSFLDYSHDLHQQVTTNRKHSIDLDTRLQRLNWLIRGWIDYFHIG